ncbi:MAG TPA: alpha/beta hydrolase-fold protein [Streptosporangiaceae bacterium]|nr:alpha/beta hydrolase-fold protein [Streptosporangiaceae bacterium]
MIAVSGELRLLVPDPSHRLAGVRLVQELRAGELPGFRRVDAGWQLDLARPPVSRMEYLLELRHADGSREVVTDPANPLRARGAFGDKSVLEFPGYRPPAWLAADAAPGVTRSLELPVKALGEPISVHVWRPADATDDLEPLPLLLVHDGPEYDRLASLTTYLAAGVTGGWLPRLRAALLAPGPRDRWYSANARYARALRTVVLPSVTALLTTTSRIGMGTSLGALAMLHAHCRYPDSFDALFLQSGSFFLPRFDSQERRFPYYERVIGFVADVHEGRLPGKPVPTTMTCGAIEENVHNNRLMAGLLRDRGYPAELHEVPDVHNYTAWRDAFDPHLTMLLRRMLP